MNNTFQKVVAIITGTILCIIGLSFIFSFLGLNLRDFVLLILGIASLIAGISKENKFLINTSVFLIPLGISVLVNNYIILFQPYSSITTSICIMISLFIIYLMYKNSLFLYSSLLLFIANATILFNFIFTSRSEITGYVLWTVGISLLVTYIFRNNKQNHISILLAVICYIFGTLNLLSSYQIISTSVYTVSIALLLLLIGILIILYATYSNKNKE